MSYRWLTIISVLVVTASSCASYSPIPLPDRANLGQRLPASEVSLDMNAVAAVAVLNNPELQTARAKASVGEAQAFAAGLLPNPQVSASLDHPTNQQTGLVNGYTLGLSYDLQALLTHPAKAAAANAARDQAQLDLLWQEWQTIAEARNLYVQSLIGAAKQEFLVGADEKYAVLTTRSARALQAGDIALDQVTGDAAVLLDIRSRLGAARRITLQAQQGLHALMGLAPDTPVPLQALLLPDVPDREAVAHALGRVSQARPDLRALQAGYRSQEKILLKSVLSQFPNISVGFTKASDTSNVHTIGLGVSLNLPLFDQGQGEIAIQQATLAQLYAEYQARLDQTEGEAWRLWTEMTELTEEIRATEGLLPQLQTTAETAARAYESGDLTVSAYLTLLNTLLGAQAQFFDLKQSLWTDAIALSTVLGTQVDPRSGKDGAPRGAVP